MGGSLRLVRCRGGGGGCGGCSSGEPQKVRAAGADRYGAGLQAGDSDVIGSAEFGAQAGYLQEAVAPHHVNFEPASGAEAFEAAVGPGFRKGGEERDFAGVALDQHFSDAGGASEIAVDLEGRVSVE